MIILRWFSDSACLLCPLSIFQMFFKKKSINSTFSSSMLNQEQPDCNAFVKELAQGLLFPLYMEDGKVLGIVAPNTGLAFRRMLAL